MPPEAPTAMLPMSFEVRISPTPRTTDSMPFCSITLPPTLLLLRPTASMTSRRETP